MNSSITEKDGNDAALDRLRDFTRTISACGGIRVSDDGRPLELVASTGDWIDLADAYQKACELLGETPVVDKETCTHDANEGVIRGEQMKQRQVYYAAPSTALDREVEALAQKLFNDKRPKQVRQSFRSYDLDRIVDRLLAVPPVEWKVATMALTELSIAEQQKVVNILESRAQAAARQASYLYLRIGPHGDSGHKDAVKRQNQTGRTLHKAFGYDARSDVNISF